MQTGHAMVQWMTDFGDQSVVLPVAAVVMLFLYRARWKRGALCWAAAIIGTLATMLLLKLGAGACGRELGTDRLDSPSGHTASATVLYGSLLSILWRGAGAIRIAAAACLIAVAFALSRVVLHDHTVLEVLVGGVVGITAAVAFHGLAGPAPASLRRGWMIGAILVAMAFVHGDRLPAERHVHSFATTRLRAWLCPVGS